MKLRQLEYVYHIVKHKTIREASKVLYVTQPTISQQVKNLEKQLGFTIFEKDGRGIRLTEHGNKIFPELKEVIECMQRLEQTVERIKNPDKGLISFGLGPIS